LSTNRSFSPDTTNAAVPSRRDRRVALLLEYDGGRFAGSQLQTNAITVQKVLEEAIVKATGEPTRVAFAGRTDAGVHATGQVAAFSTLSRLDPFILQRALNAWLPEDVVVREAVDVSPDFDPRRDARRRHYRYLIDNSPVRPALSRNRAWHLASELDVESMSEAARLLLGKRDFAAFASRLEDVAASTVRELFEFRVTRSGASIELDVEANAFLPHQVRRMAGALVEVGRGKLDVDGYCALLDGPPASAGPAAPPHGLYLVVVEYEMSLFALDSRSAVC
jgi:tRNA pseudouridine38-40 synthase